MSVSMGKLSADGVLSFGDGYRTKRSEHGKPGFRILRVADIADGFVSATGSDYVAEEWAGQIGGKLALSGDVLLTTKGTVGRVAIMPPLDEQVVYSPQLCYFRVHDKGRLDARWLSYWFRSADFMRQASHRANNTDMAAYINLADIRSLRLPVTGITEQRGIAAVLGALDDKIAANVRTRELLLQLADTSFARIVSSLPASQRLADLAVITKGVSYRRVDLDDSSDRAMVTLKSITRDGKYSPRGLKGYVGEANVGQTLVPGEVVVAQTDLTQAAEVVGRAVRVPASAAHTKLVASLDLAIVRPRDGMPVEFLLGLLRTPQFRQHCRDRTSGTTVLHLGRGAIESFCAPDVDGQSQRKYADIARPVYDLIDSTGREIDSLETTRDELLPQLMSGKIRVKDAERVVEGVV